MAKRKHTQAVTVAAERANGAYGLIGSSLTALQTSAARIVAKQTEDRSPRSYQLVSNEGGIYGLIRHGKTTVQVDGDDIAITKHD